MDKSLVTLRVFAVLIVLRALTNVFKPFSAGGLVFFGAMLTGTANAILAPLLGIYMLIYAYGLWNTRRFALPMGFAYAIFVPINIGLFPLVHGLPPNVTGMEYLGFAVVGVGVTAGAVWLLLQRRQQLA